MVGGISASQIGKYPFLISSFNNRLYNLHLIIISEPQKNIVPRLIFKKLRQILEQASFSPPIRRDEDFMRLQNED